LFLSAGALFIFCSLLPNLARGQANEVGPPQGSVSSANSDPQENRQPEDQNNRNQKRRTVAGELNRESRESAGEGEGDKFRHSASVRLVSRLTGLSVDQVYWISVAVNFGVIAGVIWWFGKKNLPGFFRQRTLQIQKAMEEARRASEDANRRLADIETRLAQMAAEINAMRSVAEKEAAAEEARLQAAAEDDARKIVQTAEQEIAAAIKSARRELTAYAADLAVSLAAKQIRVDAATDHALVSDFAAQLLSGGGGRKGGQ
jgi:F-type H+-transporting ATPase subunit b